MIKRFLLLTLCILSYPYYSVSQWPLADSRILLDCSVFNRDSIASITDSSTFKLNFEHNNINKFHNLFKNIKKTSICKVISINSKRDYTVYKDSLDSKLTKIESRANKKLQKYKPLYKIIYKLQLMTTIRFKSLLIIFIFLRTVSSLYNNINDIVSIINLIDEKDIKDIKKVLELLSFINFINIFNIVTFLELYDITEHLELINKKLLLYKKYVRLYKKDCFMINYI